MSNVRVSIRIRPVEENNCEINVKRGKTYSEEMISMSSKNPTEPLREFMFDKIFDTNASQEDVLNYFNTPVMEQLFDGQHVTVFAYGQTSSGKTHTIFGKNGIPDGVQSGLTCRLFENILRRIKRMRTEKYQIFLSFYEIYLDGIEDLCVPYKNKNISKNKLEGNVKLEIREKPDGEVYIPNLCILPIWTYDEASEVIRTGLESRKTFETKLNEQSSRSHTVLSFTIIQEESEIFGRLNLVDLAGSERLVALEGLESEKSDSYSQQRLKEHNFINSSLSALGKVILCLHNNEKHIPYRDTKLTRVLQNSLGGNCHTFLISTLSPKYYEESLETLKFSFRCKNVRNYPKVNYINITIEQKDKLIRKLESEILSLRKELLEYRKSTQLEKLELNQQISNLINEKKNNQYFTSNSKTGRFRSTLARSPSDTQISISPKSKKAEILVNKNLFFDEVAAKKNLEQQKKIYTKKIEKLEKKVDQYHEKARKYQNEIESSKKQFRSSQEKDKSGMNSLIRQINSLKKVIREYELKMSLMKKNYEESETSKINDLRERYEEKIEEYKSYISVFPNYLKSISDERDRRKRYETEISEKMEFKFQNRVNKDYEIKSKQLVEKGKIFDTVLKEKNIIIRKLEEQLASDKSSFENNIQLLQKEINLVYEYSSKLSSILYKMEKGIYPIQMRYHMKHIRIAENDLKSLGRMDIFKFVQKKLTKVTEFIHDAEIYCCKEFRAFRESEKGKVSFLEDLENSRIMMMNSMSPEKKKTVMNLPSRHISSSKRYSEVNYKQQKLRHLKLLKKLEHGNNSSFSSRFRNRGCSSCRIEKEKPTELLRSTSFLPSQKIKRFSVVLENQSTLICEDKENEEKMRNWKEKYLEEKEKLKQLRISYRYQKSELNRVQEDRNQLRMEKLKLENLRKTNKAVNISPESKKKRMMRFMKYKMRNNSMFNTPGVRLESIAKKYVDI